MQPIFEDAMNQSLSPRLNSKMMNMMFADDQSEVQAINHSAQLG
jgi:hypothetical protein